MWIIILLIATLYAASFTSNNIASLKAEWEAKLSTERTQRFYQEAKQFESVSQLMMKFECEAGILLACNDDWEVGRGLWLWLRWLRTFPSTAYLPSAERLFWRSVEMGDLSILKFIIDHDAIVNEMDLHPIRIDTDMYLIPYFRKYQLQHARVPLCELDSRLCHLLALHFSDRPAEHEFLNRFQLDPKRSPAYNYAMLRTLLIFAPRSNFKVMHANIEMVAVVKEVCEEFSVDFRDKLDEKGNRLARLIGGEWYLLTECLAPELGESEQAKLLCFLYDRWPHVIKERLHTLPLPLSLQLAWHGCNLDLQLPSVMPNIDVLIPSAISFEQASYLGKLIENYSLDALFGAMSLSEEFSTKDYLLLGIISNPNVTIEWSLLSKCVDLGEFIESYVKWRLLDNDIILNRVSQLTLPTSWLDLFMQLFPNFPTPPETNIKMDCVLL